MRSGEKESNRGRYRRGSTTLTEQQQRDFLAALMDGWSPTKAAELATCSRFAAARYRDADGHFAEAWDLAVECGTDKLEDEARRRGMDGWEEPLSYQGRKTGDTVRKFDSVLLMFMLNGRRPEKFRQNVKVEAPGLAASFAAAMAASASKYVVAGKSNGHDTPQRTET